MLFGFSLAALDANLNNIVAVVGKEPVIVSQNDTEN